MPRKRPVIAAALVLTCVLLAQLSIDQPATSAPTGGKVLVVMDTAASMGEPDGAGSPKLTAASQALTDIAANAGSVGELGLRTFGGGCSSSELASPIGPVDPGELRAAAGSMQPNGERPLSHALEQAAADVADSGPVTVVLVTDGADGCRADPTKAAGALGMDVRLDVIGLRVGDNARTQLQDVAAAGHGRYVDAVDGPTLRAMLARQVRSALSEFRPGPTTVNGTFDPLTGPVIGPGSYVDTIATASGQNFPGAWYTFNRKANETLHFSLIATPPTSVRRPTIGVNGLALAVVSEAPAICGRPGAGGSSQTGMQSVTSTLNGVDPVADCNEPGRYRLFGFLLSGTQRSKEIPVELAMRTEAPVRNVAALPGPARNEQPMAVQPTDEKQPMIGTASTFDVPELAPDATYTDTIQPGETLFYRVPVDWGQRLAARVHIPAMTGSNALKPGATTQVEMSLISPLRTRITDSADDFYDGRTLDLTASGPTVNYRNRESNDPATADTSTAGGYYVEVSMQTRAADPDFRVPIQVTAAATGKPHGEPEPAGSAPDSEPVSGTGAVDTLGSRATWGGLVAGILLIAAGSIVFWSGRHPQ